MTRPERPPFREELKRFWHRLPGKWMFGILLGAWVLLFHLYGNSTLGYIDSASLFGWLDYVYSSSADNEHGYLIPVVVLALYWWKRDALLAVPKRHWWPALLLVIVGLLLHVGGFMVQQTRVSVVGFFLGLYGLTGLVWGPAWLRTTFFPFFLFAFCVPVATLSEPLTFPLRLLATKITGWLNSGLLGISVICSGTRIYDPNGHYEYEVAAACSGLRSMTATFAMGLIYGFVAFRSWWKRAVMVVAAFPLAVVANVFRLTMIIVASEAFGQEAGEKVHASGWLSLLPYVPAVGGVFLLGWWLGRRERGSSPGDGGGGGQPVAQPA